MTLTSVVSLFSLYCKLLKKKKERDQKKMQPLSSFFF